jgi:hypothetical protein
MEVAPSERARGKVPVSPVLLTRIGAILTTITLGTSIWSVPSSYRKGRAQKDITMDWLGAATIVSGLVLVVFAITESAYASDSWRTPYIPTPFNVSCLSRPSHWTMKTLTRISLDHTLGVRCHYLVPSRNLRQER